MRKFFTPGEAKSSSSPYAENKTCPSLTLVHCNKQLATIGRTTTTYIVSNEMVDAAPEPVSYFLLPDPYAGHHAADDYYAHPDDYDYTAYRSKKKNCKPPTANDH